MQCNRLSEQIADTDTVLILYGDVPLLKLGHRKAVNRKC